MLEPEVRITGTGMEAKELWPRALVGVIDRSSIVDARRGSRGRSGRRSGGRNLLDGHADGRRH
jgi:hypothetical protein